MFHLMYLSYFKNAGFWLSGSFLLDGSWWNYNFLLPPTYTSTWSTFLAGVLTHSFLVSLHFFQQSTFSSVWTAGFFFRWGLKKNPISMFFTFVNDAMQTRVISEIKNFLLAYFSFYLWWLFLGLTRQGSVNSTKGAEVEDRPAGQ